RGNVHPCRVETRQRRVGHVGHAAPPLQEAPAHPRRDHQGQLLQAAEGRRNGTEGVRREQQQQQHWQRQRQRQRRREQRTATTSSPLLVGLGVGSAEGLLAHRRRRQRAPLAANVLGGLPAARPPLRAHVRAPDARPGLPVLEPRAQAVRWRTGPRLRGRPAPGPPPPQQRPPRSKRQQLRRLHYCHHRGGSKRRRRRRYGQRYPAGPVRGCEARSGIGAEGPQRVVPETGVVRAVRWTAGGLDGRAGGGGRRRRRRRRRGGGEEVCTASVSFVSEDFGGLVRLAIGARCFRGRQAPHAKEAWIRELTADLFMSICHKSEPKDVYLAATVGGWSSGGGGGGGGFGRALQDMGVPVLVCSSYRLHSAVSCSLGFAAGGGSEEGKRANVKMRDVVRRAVAMVEVFEHWRPEGGVFAAAAAAAAGSGPGSATTLETVRVEVEELAAALARARGDNPR
ncbi:unnamed protein product, partial [Ectocarpus fasciculatus]